VARHNLDLLLAETRMVLLSTERPQLWVETFHRSDHSGTIVYDGHRNENSCGALNVAN
jgi:hypothetical protein